jgi:hypothetical protein
MRTAPEKVIQMKGSVKEEAITQRLERDASTALILFCSVERGIYRGTSDRRSQAFRRLDSMPSGVGNVSIATKTHQICFS